MSIDPEYLAKVRAALDREGHIGIDLVVDPGDVSYMLDELEHASEEVSAAEKRGANAERARIVGMLRAESALREELHDRRSAHVLSELAGTLERES